MFNISNRLEKMIWQEIHKLNELKQRDNLNVFGEGLLYGYNKVLQAAKALDEEDIECMAIENISVYGKVGK
jgi:hypothetical protein